jgi:hypothetical protein
MPTFNQLCLIVSYMENIQIEPDAEGNLLWMNKCDEMMTEGEFENGSVFLCSLLFKS